MKRSLLELGFLLAVFLALVSFANATDAPVLFFSDLTWGPKTGWEGSASKGAAVSIWGLNFGASGTITVCGQTLTSGTASIPEWAVTTNPVNARGMSRITFYLNSSMNSGVGTISVTTGGVTSNTLPFTIATGTIYFVDTVNGSNSNDGSTTALAWKDIYKAGPYYTPGDNQYIAYVRSGTYSVTDPGPQSSVTSHIKTCGNIGGTTKQKALIAYPGEAPIVTATNWDGHGFLWNQCGGLGNPGVVDYFTLSKLTFDGTGHLAATGVIGWEGQYNRIIGNIVEHFRPTAQLQAGWIGFIQSQYLYIYGNLIYDVGFDNMGHAIYIKVQNGGVEGATGYVAADRTPIHDVFIGWNEFNDFTSPCTGVSNPSVNCSGYGRGPAIYLSVTSGMSPYTLHDAFIFSNLIKDSVNFLAVGDGYPSFDNIYSYNNIMYGGPSDTTQATALIDDTAYHVYFYNNTWYQIGNPSMGIVVGSGTSNEHLYSTNNLYSGQNSQPQLYQYNGGSASSTTDLYWSPNGFPQDPSALSQSWVTVTGEVKADPKLNNPGSYDFTLQSSSPAIGAGTNLNTTFTTDYMGKTRGSTWDIGAIQYAAGSGGGGGSGAASALSGGTCAGCTIH